MAACSLSRCDAPVKLSFHLVAAALVAATAPALAQSSSPSTAAPTSPPSARVLPPEAGGGFAFPVGPFTVRLLPYIQAQYEHHADSEEELSSDGLRLLNQDRFVLRRGRVVLGLEHRWAQMVFEADVNTVHGVAFGVRQAEASLRLPPNDRGLSAAMVTVGMFRTPFGFETLRSARERVFMENSTVAQAFFPGESDLGARVQGALGWFRYAVAVVNGHPVDEVRYGATAPLAPRDVVGRLGVDVRARTAHVTAGVSALGGAGFHAGTPQGVDALGVRDVAENGVLTPDSLVLLQGRAAVRSQSFVRFAVGADAAVELRLGARVAVDAYAEVMFGQNMDRGLFPSDPVGLGHDLRGLGVVAGGTVRLFDRVLLGVRFDHYDPNVDSTATQAGVVVLAPRSVTTESVLAGFQVPGTGCRIVAQYDFIQDHLALGTDGLPTDLANDRFTLRVQVSP